MEFHGKIAAKKKSIAKNWKLPNKTVSCTEKARPGYSALISDEYEDHDDTLKDKISVLVAMIRRSQNGCIYTGAGISRSSGIPDYASSDNEKISRESGVISPFDAMPSRTHQVLSSLINYGYLKHWIQQNHDGTLSSRNDILKR